MRKLFPLVLIVCLACGESKESDPRPSDPLHALDTYGKALARIEQLTNELEYFSRLARAGAPELLSSCATVDTRTEDAFTIYKLSFTNTACTDGKVRDGELEIAINPETLDVIIQSIGWKTDGVYAEGIYSFQPVTEASIDYTKLTTIAGKIILEDEDWISFSTTKQYKWREGESTSAANDDVLEIASGEYSFSVKNSGLCQLEIEAPLQVTYACAERSLLPVSGKVLVETLQETTHVTFGNGECASVPTQE